MSRIADLQSLRALYVPVNPRSAAKQLDRLDPHCRLIIELSPFAVMATYGADGLVDVTPRGDAPGFVAIEDDKTLLLPDRPGNNRLDSLQNIIVNPAASLLFLVPGVDETLRVQGEAEIRDDPELLARFDVAGRLPRTVIRITVREAYLHCAKALMRSRLWDPSVQIDRATLPSIGEMLRDQIGLATGETQAEMLTRYQASLY